MSELENGFRLSDVKGLVQRRALILLGGLVLGIVLGFLAFSTAPARYSATSRVQVKPLSLDPLKPTGGAEAVDIVTERDLVRSDEVTSRVIEELGLDVDNRTLRRRVTPTSKEDSLVIEITYEGTDSEEAEKAANAFADAYLAMRQEDAQRKKHETLQVTAARAEFTRNALDAARAEGDSAAVQEFQAQLNDLNRTANSLDAIDPSDTGRVVQRAATADAVASKAALGKGVGVIALCVGLGLGVALLVDRSDSLGGGRRRIQQILPGTNARLMPSVTNPKATQAEIDAAVDRLAIELTSEGSRGKAIGVMLVGTGPEPPVRLAEEISSSLSFAGIPAVFVVAASTRAELKQARLVASFTDLLDQQGLDQPELPERSAAAVGTASKVAWLRPRGSAESSGLLQRAVVDALINRASRDGFHAVIFLAASPTHQATAAALGRWVHKSALVVPDDDALTAEKAAEALREADVDVSEVVWT